MKRFSCTEGGGLQAPSDSTARQRTEPASKPVVVSQWDEVVVFSGFSCGSRLSWNPSSFLTFYECESPVGIASTGTG